MEMHTRKFRTPNSAIVSTPAVPAEGCRPEIIAVGRVSGIVDVVTQVTDNGSPAR
jgi:hypothetical protein